ncbi:hypothetical protein EAX61_01215 [Dokdonia sinensis]|uniref:Uncharacterized protein n=1 Tax=Dokdonia sinensis TaxID=2479847 RepID=A0A3M0GS31_9FLAO|nr:hypothetical protein [Dokdonia sinensis]RMB64029.1 hypothetical protein EAX61_01215 [Dokdonia sinensis]
METKKNKLLNTFTDKMIKSAGLEEPATDFTAQIMQKVEALEASKTIVYEPLISKRVWWGIAVVIVSVLGYVMFTGKESTMFSNAVAEVTSQAPSWELPRLDFEFDVSNVMVYSFLILAGFVVVEIPLLRRMMKF